MKLLELVINNFMSIREAKLYLSDKGLVLVQGENQDPDGADSNGSGKSTAMNAILWCNYGEAGKDVGTDDVVNDKVGKNCMVQCTWLDEDTGIYYRVTRYRKHKEFKNALTLEQATEGDDWQDQTKGTDKLTQAEVNRALGADLVIFKASAFAAQEDAPDIPNMTDKELKELLEKTLPFDDLSEAHKEATLELAMRSQSVKAAEDELRATTFDIELLKGQLDDLRAKSKARTDGMSLALDEIEMELNRLEEIRSALLVTLHDKDKLQAAYDVVAKKLGELDHDGSRPNQAIVTQAETLVKKAKLELKAFIEKERANCPTCLQELGKDERATVLATLKTAAINAVESHKKVAEAYDKAWDAYAEWKKIDDKASKIAEMMAHNKTVRNQIAEIDNKVTRLDNEVVAMEKDPYVELITDIRSKLQKLEPTLPAKEKAVADAKEQQEVYQEAQKTFSPTGVRYHMLETVTPELNDKTNYYLAMLTDGAISAIWSTVTQLKSGEYREKFSIVPVKGKRQGFGGLSGGEKRKVRLACFFALQDMIAERATKNISLWCADEIDAALDTSGLERLMVLLQEKAKSKGTIVVISHHALQEWIPNIVTVTKKDDVSTITGYLSEE